MTGFLIFILALLPIATVFLLLVVLRAMACTARGTPSTALPSSASASASRRPRLPLDAPPPVLPPPTPAAGGLSGVPQARRRTSEVVPLVSRTMASSSRRGTLCSPLPASASVLQKTMRAARGVPTTTGNIGTPACA